MKHVYFFRQVLVASLLFITQLSFSQQGGVVDASTFGTGTSGGLNFVSQTAITSTQKILLAGNFTSFDGNAQAYITRLNADGTFDGTFNTGGAGTNLVVRALKIRSDNKIWIGGGFFLYNTLLVPGGIILLNEDGTRDFSYNPATGTDNQVNSIDILPSSGDIVAGGLFSSFNGTAGIGKLARISATGVLNTTFNTNIGTGAAGGDVEVVLIQPDEKILVGGSFTTWNGSPAGGIVRLNSDGTLDGTFTTNVGTGAGSTVRSLALQSTNSILVGGDFASWNGTSGINRLVRLSSAGVLDAGFTAGASSSITSILVKSNDDFFIGGSFTIAGTTSPAYFPTRNGIGAYKANGIVDDNFVPNPGTNGGAFVNSIALQSNGNIVIAGSFTSFNGATRGRVARLYGDLNTITANETATITGVSANNVYALGSTPGTVLAKIVPNGGGTAVSGNVTVQVFFDPTVQYYGNIPYLQRHYEITPAAGSTARVTLYFTQAEFNAFNLTYNGNDLPYNGADVEGNKANIRFTKYAGSSTGGTGNPGDYTGGQSLIDPVDSDIIWNAATGKWEVTFNVTGFSGFFMQTNLNLLPVTLKTFTAEAVQGGAKLNWTTASEQKSSHFIVERSVDGNNYRSAGRVNAAGNSQSTRNYSLVDDLSKVPHGGVVYYRLYMVDKDGTGMYSKVQTVKPGKSNAGAALLTNPVGAEARIMYQANVGEKVTLRLLDSRGQLVSQRQEQVAAGSNQIRISTANLAKGIYMLEVTGNGERNTIRLVKE